MQQSSSAEGSDEQGNRREVSDKMMIQAFHNMGFDATFAERSRQPTVQAAKYGSKRNCPTNSSNQGHERNVERLAFPSSSRLTHPPPTSGGLKTRTIPLPKTHIHRTESEAQLQNDTLAAEFREFCMFHRLVKGMQKRSDGRAPTKKTVMEYDSSFGIASGKGSASSGGKADQPVRPLTQAAPSACLPPSSHCESYTYNDPHQCDCEEDNNAGDDYGFFVGGEYLDPSDSNDANTGDPFRQAVTLFSQDTSDKMASLPTGDESPSRRINGEVKRSSVASFNDQDDAIFELEM